MLAVGIQECDVGRFRPEKIREARAHARSPSSVWMAGCSTPPRPARRDLRVASRTVVHDEDLGHVRQRARNDVCDGGRGVIGRDEGPGRSARAGKSPPPFLPRARARRLNRRDEGSTLAARLGDRDDGAIERSAIHVAGPRLQISILECV